MGCIGQQQQNTYTHVWCYSPVVFTCQSTVWVAFGLSGNKSRRRTTIHTRVPGYKTSRKETVVKYRILESCHRRYSTPKFGNTIGDFDCYCTGTCNTYVQCMVRIDQIEYVEQQAQEVHGESNYLCHTSLCRNTWTNLFSVVRRTYTHSSGKHGNSNLPGSIVVKFKLHIVQSKCQCGLQCIRIQNSKICITSTMTLVSERFNLEQIPQAEKYSEICWKILIEGRKDQAASTSLAIKNQLLYSLLPPKTNPHQQTNCRSSERPRGEM